MSRPEAVRFPEVLPIRKSERCAGCMSVTEIVADLNALHDLAEEETDPVRRRHLAQLRSRLARRDKGAKVSEAAELLAVSPPTVRSWIDAGVLEEVSESSPVRVDILSLAGVKRIVDLLRAHGHDRDLLSEVHRRLRDHDLLESAEAAAGIEDAHEGREWTDYVDDVMPLCGRAAVRDRRRSPQPSRRGRS